MRAYLALAIVLSSLLAQAGALAEPVKLPTEPGWLPYRLALRPTELTALHADESWMTGVLVFDIDGDGFHERIEARENALSCNGLSDSGAITQLWWQTLDPEFTYRAPCASLDGVWDVTGSGRRELVATMHTKDATRWRVMRLDVATGEVLGQYDLAGGRDEKRVDGRWDGFFRVIGVVDTGSGRALIVAASAGHDEQPRGVFAVDVASGAIVWEYLVGPKLGPRRQFIADLDGDGSPEICFAGDASENIEQGLFNGTSDDTTRVFILEANGSLRWQKKFDPYPGHIYLAICDSDGDGRFEIFVLSTDSKYGSRLQVFDPAGHERARLDFPTILGHLVVYPVPGLGARVYAGVSGAGLTRIDWMGGELTAVKEVVSDENALQVILVADVLADPEPELLVGGVKGGFAWLLDADLDPLARVQIEPHSSLSQAGFVWRPAPDRESLVVRRYEDEPPLDLAIVPVPRPWPIKEILGSGLLLGGVGFEVRRRRRKPSPAVLRKWRLDILENLKLSSHGAIGALVALRNLLRQHTFSADAELFDADWCAVYASCGRDILQNCLPELNGLIEIARKCGVERSACDFAAEAVKRTGRLMEELAAAGFTEESVGRLAGQLQQADQEIEVAFQAIRNATAAHFVAAPREIVVASLAAQTDRVTAAGASVLLPAEDAPPCQVDPAELKFVLDNLVENAIRAVTDSARKEITFRWAAAGDQLVLQVADTGCGIPENHWAQVMRPGYPGRQGTGLGLPASKTILRKYGGDLMVKESVVGAGTTMVMTCPLAAVAGKKGETA